MGVAKQGRYVCKGSVDTGPLGGVLEGEAEVTESDWKQTESE